MSICPSTALVASLLVLFWSPSSAGSEVGADSPAVGNFISTVVNPGCNLTECNGLDVNLVYAKSAGENYTAHYLWSSFGSESSPGFFVVRGKPGDELDINWERLLNNSDLSKSIQLSSATNSIGIAVTRLFFWNDTQNDGQFKTNANQTDSKSWADLTLLDVRPTVNTSKNLIGSSSATFSFVDTESNLTISLNVFASPTDGRNDVLPKLQYTDQSFHVEIIIKGSANDSLVNPRIGAEFALFQSYGNFKPTRIKSIDDEYSPGVFSRMVGALVDGDKKSYILWKPVGYSKTDRIIAHTLDANLWLNPNLTDSPELPTSNAPLYGFFSGDDKSKVSLFNLTFGSASENFYKESNFTSFSFVVGLGEPLEEKLSPLVGWIITVGFGLPVIVVLLSTVYILMRRCRVAREDADSLLSTES